MQHTPLRLGTRGSPLARAQADLVRSLICTQHGFEQSAVEIVIIKTTGDAIQDRPLSEVGGKGLFTKELEDALLQNEIDLAVHSMKDVATRLPDRLQINAILPREDVRDAFISLEYSDIADLREGACVGTSSLRRRAQIKRLRPDIKVIEFRGNVGTRLEKLKAGLADATFLACAGLNRLGLEQTITSVIETDVMLPAAAQAAIGIETRSDDKQTIALVAPLNDQATACCVDAERAFLRVLDGSCRTPIAALASLASGKLRLSGETLSLDGQRHLTTIVTGDPADAMKLGEQAGQDLLQAGAKALMGTS